MLKTTTVLLPPSTTIFVHALSHAAQEQRIRIDPPDGHGDAARFVGSGENVTMTLETPGFITPPAAGWASFTTPDSPDRSEHEYRVTLESPDDSLLHTASCDTVTRETGKNSRYATVMVVSEDQIDHDFNDSVLLFTYFIPPEG